MIRGYQLSIIITTYNRPDTLEAVLKALNAQTEDGFEVLVADDGSTDETRTMLARFPARFHLQHVWQPDEGFRAARARNLGIAQADGAYIIFLDGDCIPRSDFVARHCDLAETGSFVSGNRVLCHAAFTDTVLNKALPIWAWSNWQWLKTYVRGGVNRLTPMLALPDGGWRQRDALQHWRGVKTCNLGAWRDALMAINGFDESYHGWGHEDADLAVRLLQSGLRRKDGRFAVPVWHLWHPEASRQAEAENLQRLEATLQQKRSTVARQGIAPMA
jgi:glycosyltransferase involved in cell wall biosynthesis